MVKKYETLDSGKRKDYESGLRRDTQEGKPRFDLLIVKGIPYEEQLVTRYAALRERGATKYGDRNCELANTQEEMNRFVASASRHFFQWLCGEDDEDHMSASIFNMQMVEMVKYKLKTNKTEKIVIKKKLTDKEVKKWQKRLKNV